MSQKFSLLPAREHSCQDAANRRRDAGFACRNTPPIFFLRHQTHQIGAWSKEKTLGDELAAGGQLTHTKERPVRTADKIQKSPASCADRCSLNNCILASAGMAFIWLQRGYHLLLFPLPLSILWGWFPKAGAEAHPFLLRGVSKGESGEAPPGAE